MGMLPALNKEVIGRKFKRISWDDSGNGYAFTDNGLEWMYSCQSVPNTYLTHGNQIQSDWYEVGKTTMSSDMHMSEDGLKIRSEKEEAALPDMAKILKNCPVITKVESFDKVLTEEEIKKIYKDENLIFSPEKISKMHKKEKERNMREFRFKQYTKEEMEAMKSFTDLEKRTKYTGELYGSNGEGRGILAFDKKSDAKELLADPDNLGCYIVLRKEVAVYTTAVPVVKVKV